MKNFGFTLIEIIIVTGVVAIFSGISFAYYSQFSQKNKLESQVTQLEDVLYLARKKSMANDFYDPTCLNFNGYQIKFIGNQQYEFYFCCEASCGVNTLINTYYLSSPVTFSYVPTSSVLFKPGTGQIDEETTITFEDSTLNKCFQIAIKQSGLINTDKLICP